MPREKKDAVHVNFKLDRKIADRLDKYCSIMGQTKTTAIERILKAKFDEINANEADPAKKTTEQ